MKIKKDLFNIDYNNSIGEYGAHPLKACDPCSAVCKKINNKINGRKFSEIKKSEIKNIISYFDI